jgi:hypothetical protein
MIKPLYTQYFSNPTFVLENNYPTFAVLFDFRVLWAASMPKLVRQKEFLVVYHKNLLISSFFEGIMKIVKSILWQRK